MKASWVHGIACERLCLFERPANGILCVRICIIAICADDQLQLRRVPQMPVISRSGRLRIIYDSARLIPRFENTSSLLTGWTYKTKVRTTNFSSGLQHRHLLCL